MIKILLFLLLISASPRQELAKHIFNFVNEHAKRDPFNPLDYLCIVDPYDLHFTAKQLYGTKPLPEINMPDSDFERGCYEPYAINVWFEHDYILAEIKGLIQNPL